MISKIETQGMPLVTGVAGFIGFHVAARFLQNRIPVLGIDNFEPSYDREIKESNIRDLHAIAMERNVMFEFVAQDITQIEPSFANGRLCGVIHLAAKTGVRDSVSEAEFYNRTNVGGTLRILELCRVQGIDRLLFASSSSVYGDNTSPPFSEDARADRPLSPYAASKRAGELFCATYAHLHDVRTAVLRFFTVYGPRQRPKLAIHEFTRLIDRGEPIRMFGDGSSQRSYTYIDDLVDGIFAAWRYIRAQPPRSFEAINLCGPETVSLKDLITTIEFALGKRAVVVEEPEQQGDIRRSLADYSKAKNILGYAPQVFFQEGISRFVDWYREVHSDPLRHIVPQTSQTTDLGEAQ